MVTIKKQYSYKEIKMSSNYFNTLPLRRQIEELSKCRFMDASEINGVDYLKGKKIVIVGCGAQGLNQGLNLRDL